MKGVRKGAIFAVLASVLIFVGIFAGIMAFNTSSEKKEEEISQEEKIKEETGGDKAAERVFEEPKGVSETKEETVQSQNDSNVAKTSSSRRITRQNDTSKANQIVENTEESAPKSQEASGENVDLDELARLEEEKKREEERIRALMEAATGYQVAGINSYPAKRDCPEKNATYQLKINNILIDGLVCQCTSYVSYKVYEKHGYLIRSWGNANSWAERAEVEGKVVDNTPESGSVGQISDSLGYGHVFWVENVNSDGSIDISEYNLFKVGDYDSRRIPVEGVSQYKYIHF